MLNPEDEVCFDLRSSCTAEQGAAMILGWLRGEKRARYIRVTLDGINPDQFPYLPELPDTLEATIREQREKASIEFHNAVVNDEFVIAEAKEAIVEDWDKLAKRARRYMIDIGDELTKTDSALRIDQRTTIATGVTHITLKSLDQWSRKEYGIAILDDAPQGEKTVAPSAELILTNQSPEPWLIRDPKDPAPEQPWYTAARYFARNLSIDDSTLLTKKDLLAQKVAQSLTAVGIMKRGGAKPLDPATIKKAFSNVVF